MTDPCWLPSAIMQTLGALYGIFIVVYIFLLQYMEKNNINTEKDSEFISFLKFEKYFSINLFTVISFIIMFTIAINGAFIYMLILHNIKLEYFINICFISFIISLVSIFIFSIILINTLMHKEKSEELYQELE